MTGENTKVQLDKSKKDHWLFKIGKIEIGEFERSELRYIIQQIDNEI